MYGSDPLEWPTNLGLSPQRYKVVRKTAGAMLQAFHEDNEYRVFEEYMGIEDNDERMALWAILRPHPAVRACVKRQADAIKEQTQADHR